MDDISAAALKVSMPPRGITGVAIPPFSTNTITLLPLGAEVDIGLPTKNSPPDVHPVDIDEPSKFSLSMTFDIP